MSMRYRSLDGTNGQVYLGTNGTSDFYVGTPRYRTCVDELHAGPPYKTGGPFLKLETRYHRGLTSPILWYGIGVPRRYYSGSFTDSWLGTYPSFGVGADLLPSTYQKSDAEMRGLGATGWNRFKPGNPGASMGQFIGELHRLPTIPFIKSLGKRNFERLKDFRSYGGEYLNYTFGWVPFLRDLRDMYKLQHDMARHLAQLRRDNGKVVRRHGSLHRVPPVSTVSESEHASVLYPILTSEFYTSSKGRRTITVDYTDKVWFSAAFRYWIPDINSPHWPASAKRALFGLNPSPSLLWELLPWSWLIDWFSNVGDVVNNMTDNAAENLVADYAYIMASRSKTYTCQNVQPFYHGTLHQTTRVEYSCKQRQPASPYGFYVEPIDITGRRALILSALGISRLPRR